MTVIWFRDVGVEVRKELGVGCILDDKTDMNCWQVYWQVNERKDSPSKTAYEEQVVFRATSPLL